MLPSNLIPGSRIAPDEGLALASARAREAHYRWVLENIADAVWRIACEPAIPIDLPVDEQVALIYERGYLAECNDGMARLNGFASAAEIHGVKLDQIMPAENPENTAYLRAFVESAYAVRGAESVERTRDGELKYLLNDLIGIVIDGKLAGAWGSSRDVTAHKRADERLRDSEERLRGIVQSATDFAIITTDMHGLISSWSPGAERIFEFSSEEILGRNAKVIYTPEDCLCGVPESEMQISLRDGRATDERWHIRATGERFWGSGVMSPLRGTAGQVSGYVKILRDTTAQRDTTEALRVSEQRVQLVLQTSRIGFWYCDLPMAEIKCDAQVKAQFGLCATDIFMVDTFYARVHPDDRERTRQAVERCINERALYDIDYRTLAPDGTIRWLHALGRTSLDTQGVAIRFDGITIDITDRKHVELALARAKREAETASQAKDDFLAALSHELRTPLAPVLMTLTSLADEPSLPGHMRDDLEVIRRNVELETKLIDDLLDLTRIARGKVELRLGEVNVHSLLQQVVQTCRDGDPRSQTPEVTLELSAAEFHVQGDAARLQQVFWNLLKNALKFTPADGLIRVQAFTPSPGVIRIAVSDNGLGIEPQKIGRLFQAFEQGGREVTQRFGGLGLGLAIAKRVVELHGGRIEARSQGAGHGSTFTVDLRAGPAKLPDALPQLADLKEALGPLRVLLVEDHQPTARILQRLLEKKGHTVEAAGTLAEARRLAASAQFDLVVSDLGLPDGSGLELMPDLRSRYGLPGIALSGFGMESDMAASEEAGFSAHLVKPVDWPGLEKVIGEVMGRQ